MTARIRPCPSDCAHCEELAEQRAAEDLIGESWRDGLDRFERELDQKGPHT